MRKTISTGIVLLMLLALVACATIQANFGIKPWAQKTPSEKSLAILDTYNTEFRNTLSQAMTPNLTEAQKQVVRTKKEILKQAHLLIGLYDSTVINGGTPTKSDEDAILVLFDKIGAKIAGR